MLSCSLSSDAVALVFMLLLNTISDKLRSRGIFVAIVFIINAVGWIILLAVVNDQQVRYFACFCITIGGYAAIPLVMSWQGSDRSLSIIYFARGLM
jgi:hypothetical protein